MALISIGEKRAIDKRCRENQELERNQTGITNLQCPNFGKIIDIIFLKRYRGTQQAGLLE